MAHMYPMCFSILLFVESEGPTFHGRPGPSHRHSEKTGGAAEVAGGRR